jgi:hypothetical protein
MKGYESIAQALEAEAAMAPPSMKRHAKTLREAAELMRKLDNGRIVWVGKLIKDDPDSN